MGARQRERGERSRWGKEREGEVGETFLQHCYDWFWADKLDYRDYALQFLHLKHFILMIDCILIPINDVYLVLVAVVQQGQGLMGLHAVQLLSYEIM